MTTLKTLTVYLGSSGRARPLYQEAAESFGGLIGESGLGLVYGGMDAGLMGQVAAGALRAGATVTGIIPKKLQDSERILKGLSETILVEDLWERKQKMFERADAIVTLPGGFGTLDETLEVLYWGSLKLHAMPLVLVNIEGYWDRIIDYLETLPDFDRCFLLVVPDIEDAIPALKNWSPPSVVKQAANLPHFEDEILRETSNPIIIDKANIANSYYAICALGLKQLGKHARPIGFLNTDNQFGAMIDWLHRAEKEKFITEKCLTLFDTADTEERLTALLKTQSTVSIDLHKEKWGERRGNPRQ